MDFELEACEQQKIIADQVMVYMELKIIKDKNYNFNKEYNVINKIPTNNRRCYINISRLV